MRGQAGRGLAIGAEERLLRALAQPRDEPLALSRRQAAATTFFGSSVVAAA